MNDKKKTFASIQRRYEALTKAPKCPRCGYEVALITDDIYRCQNPGCRWEGPR